MVAHHRLFYADLADPVALLRHGPGDTGLARHWAYARNARPDDLASGDVAAYTRLMAASQHLIAEEILAAYPLRRHRHLLDVAGGDGSFIVQAAADAPGLRFTLFELPAVTAHARARLEAAGCADRVGIHAGDLHRDPLPRGADLATLIRVVHDHDDDAALAVLAKVREALPAGGRLLLAEPMAGADAAGPGGDAYFGFYLLAMGQGRPRSARELAALLRAAGFRRSRRLNGRTPLFVSLIVAEA